MCYVTLPGLVYFGSSIHVYHGFQMMVNMFYDLFSTAAPKNQSINVSNIDIIFNCCFLTLGLLVFRGVERKSKTFIKWPTIGFTLLLAARFILEILKQIERERNGSGKFNLSKQLRLPNSTTSKNFTIQTNSNSAHTNSPFSYSSMSIDVDPLISASVGIYIFILFVYNHSLEYDASAASSIAGINLNSNMNSVLPPAGPPIDCGASDASSDTVLLINTPQLTTISSQNSGDSNNNRNMQMNILNSINTRANPLYELSYGVGGRNLNIAPVQRPDALALGTSHNSRFLRENLNEGNFLNFSPTASPTDDLDPEYKIDAV